MSMLRLPAIQPPKRPFVDRPMRIAAWCRRRGQPRPIVAIWRRISRARSASEPISNARAITNITATTPPCATPTSAAKKGADQQRRSDEGAEHRKVNGSAEQLHPTRERVADRLPHGRFEGGKRARAQRSVLIDDPLHPGNQNRQKPGDGAEHKSRRGRVRNRRAEVIDIADDRHAPLCHVHSGPALPTSRFGTDPQHRSMKTSKWNCNPKVGARLGVARKACPFCHASPYSVPSAAFSFR